jgi:hypothetical protein
VRVTSTSPGSASAETRAADVYRDPGDAAVAARELAGVEPAAHLEAVVLEGVADVPGAADPSRRAVEGREHPVAGSVDQFAAVRSENTLDGRLEPSEERVPAAVADLRHALGGARDVEEEHRCQEPVDVTVLRARSDHELLDRAEQIGVADRPVIRTVAL